MRGCCCCTSGPLLEESEAPAEVRDYGAVFGSVTIPESLAGFGTNDEGRLRRQAISKAINREEITKKPAQDARLNDRLRGLRNNLTDTTT